ncbi:MAG: hypothetical protein ACFFDW_17255, partial [Candidatus Thorarchaeota archaeon]
MVANFTCELLLKFKQQSSFTIIVEILNYPDPERTNHLANFSLALLGEYSRTSETTMQQAMDQMFIWVNHPFWEIREMCVYPLRLAYSKFPNQVLTILNDWIKSSNENIRRTAIESLRPLSVVKWLRDPKKNDPIIHLLSQVRADPSIYV